MPLISVSTIRCSRQPDELVVRSIVADGEIRKPVLLDHKRRLLDGAARVEAAERLGLRYIKFEERT